MLNPFTPTDRFSSFQNNEWNSLLKLVLKGLKLLYLFFIYLTVHSNKMAILYNTVFYKEIKIMAARINVSMLYTYLAMETSNSPKNCFSEVWYILLTRDISHTKKYRMLPLVATVDRKQNI